MQTEEKSVEPHDVLNVFSAIVKDNRQAMAEFNQAMQRREELSIRIGRRTTQILRYGVIGMLLINGILFFLVQSLSRHIHDMSNNIQTISTNVTEMERSFKLVNQQMGVMNQSIGTMQASTQYINYHLGIMTGQVGMMSQDVDKMSSPMRFFPFR
ncbi:MULTISPECIES: hypothetical protein [Thiothrix]|jgi:uncharacterized protein YoxC|uniref:Translation initiation factor 2 n=1 Tax=Thiothrix unzii TaxID=111769 RepID=A0A975F8M1_9GAMM|nr:MULTISPECIES: hypothetical protein [Thiothrix]QTR53222.1 hypothetical protein J9260_16200 [Thiothrix unzii]